ncbi:MAG: aldehyde ferredoxin oxidoreductase C-terminal domain-containing protein, partial [Chloroflexi bacterium]|nr:aldehyde ferredoxin oxidoreductase C-terminal domain-containing protein [Chloroflexota bacterium]
EGLRRRTDDRLPARLHTPLEGGPLTGTSIDRAAFEEAISGLYARKGWDPDTGIPSREKLAALGIEWTADLVGVG